MTIDLEAIQQACDEATPGPWRVDWDGPWPEIVLIGGHTLIDRMEGCSGKNADLIVGARTWIPALLARVRELEANAERYVRAAAGSIEVMTRYEQDVLETNEALDAAGLHIGSGDLSTLVRGLIQDADNGREALRAEREACAKLCETHDSSMARLGGGLYDSDRHALRLRGNELAAAIRGRGA